MQTKSKNHNSRKIANRKKNKKNRSFEMIKGGGNSISSVFNFSPSIPNLTMIPQIIVYERDTVIPNKFFIPNDGLPPARNIRISDALTDDQCISNNGVLYIPNINDWRPTFISNVRIVKMIVHCGVTLTQYPPNLTILVLTGETGILDEVDLSVDTILPVNLTKLFIFHCCVRSDNFNGIMNCNKLKGLTIWNSRFSYEEPKMNFGGSEIIVPQLPDSINQLRLNYTIKRYSHGDFNLIDTKFEFTNIPKSIVIFMVNTSCDISDGFLPRIIDLNNDVNTLNITDNTVRMLYGVHMAKFQEKHSEDKTKILINTDLIDKNTPNLYLFALFKNKTIDYKNAYDGYITKYNRLDIFRAVIDGIKYDMKNVDILSEKSIKDDAVKLNGDMLNNIKSFIGGKSTRRKRRRTRQKRSRRA